MSAEWRKWNKGHFHATSIGQETQHAQMREN